MQLMRLAGFHPKRYPGLLVDLDPARQPAADGDPLASWTDQSGNGYHAVQATGSAQPTLQRNVGVRGSVHYETDDGMQIANLPLGVFTIYCVFRASVNGLLYEHSADINANNGTVVYTSTGATLAAKKAAGFSQKDLSVDWGLGNVWRVFVHTMDGTHAGHTIHLSGAVQTLIDGTNTGNPGTAVVTDTFNIGSRNAASLFITGDVARLLIYGQAHDVGVRRTIEGQLGRHYGIATVIG